ncbi:MAG: flagellar assembly protein FliW [Gaiellales bacterium]
MLLESTRFGEIEVDDTDVLTLPDGLIGLPGTTYTLLTIGEDSPFRWLHSVDDPELALPVSSPWSFFSDYEVRVPDDDVASLGLEDAGAAEILCVVRAAEELENFTINLAAPIVIHRGRGVARQVINEVIGYDVRQPLLSEAQLTELRKDDSPEAQAS